MIEISGRPVQRVFPNQAKERKSAKDFEKSLRMEIANACRFNFIRKMHYSWNDPYIQWKA